MKELKSLIVVMMVSTIWGLLGPLLSAIAVGIMYLFGNKSDSITASFALAFIFAKLVVILLVISYLIAIFGAIKTHRSLVKNGKLVHVSKFSVLFVAMAVMATEAMLFVNIWEWLIEGR